MKKYLILAVALIGMLTASAQNMTGTALPEGKCEVGQTVDINGIPGYVFYVEDNGQHGLVMTYPALSPKELEKEAKKGKRPGIQLLAERHACFDFDAYKKAGMTEPAKKEEIYTPLVDITGKYGLENQIAIVNYCAENGIDLKETYPLQYYCTLLGNGWFVPSYDELRQLSIYLLGGFGKDDYIKHKTINDKMTEFKVTIKGITKDAFHELYMNQGCIGSQMLNPFLGFQALLFHHFNNNKSYTVCAPGWKGKDPMQLPLIPVYKF